MTIFKLCNKDERAVCSKYAKKLNFFSLYNNIQVVLLYIDLILPNSWVFLLLIVLELLDKGQKDHGDAGHCLLELLDGSQRYLSGYSTICNNPTSY